MIRCIACIGVGLIATGCELFGRECSDSEQVRTIAVEATIGGVAQTVALAALWVDEEFDLEPRFSWRIEGGRFYQVMLRDFDDDDRTLAEADAIACWCEDYMFRNEMLVCDDESENCQFVGGDGPLYCRATAAPAECVPVDGALIGAELDPSCEDRVGGRDCAVFARFDVELTATLAGEPTHVSIVASADDYWRSYECDPEW